MKAPGSKYQAQVTCSLYLDLDSANPFGNEVVNERTERSQNKPHSCVDQSEKQRKTHSKRHETDTLLRWCVRRKGCHEKEERHKQKPHNPIKNSQHLPKLQRRDSLDSSFSQWRWLVHRLWIYSGGWFSELGAFPYLMLEHKDTFLIPHRDIWIFFVSDEASDYLCADTRVIIDQLRNEIRLARRWPHQFEPVKDRRRIGLGIALRSMRPKPLPGHNIFQAIAIHIHQ